LLFIFLSVFQFQKPKTKVPRFSVPLLTLLALHEYVSQSLRYSYFGQSKYQKPFGVSDLVLFWNYVRDLDAAGRD